MSKVPVYVADRVALFKDLEHFVIEHQAEEKKLAILLININHFRRINIVYGYQVGDALLTEFTRRLRHLSRAEDYIARMGNSEFIMVLPGILNEGHATLAAHKLLSSFDEPFDLGEHKHKITADMGIALFPDHADNIPGLFQKAEIALLDARNRVQSYSIYSDNAEQHNFNAWDIEAALENALAGDEFELFFQPQICLQTGHVFGAEALIRWNNHDRGYIRPDFFIPVAEKNGQIHSITWWTINTALRLMKDWPDSWVPLKVAVNLSTKILMDPDLTDSVNSALNLWGVNHHQFTLEVTESALMDDMAASFAVLDELKSLGLNISIDDFGTGYSSMSYFKYVPANELKIDQSFVRFMLESDMDRHIVNTVIKMAHGFELKVVAEGIENEETYEALKALGCDVAQGHYLAKPMPQQAFMQWLDDYNQKKLSKD